MKPVRTLIVDDEPLARQSLARLVGGVSWMTLIGEATHGAEALAMIDDHHPDLVFLDIRMPGMSGLEVVERMTHQPQVIFTTAYDVYAVKAFELQALDYLLKPFGRRRFEQAIARLTEQAPHRAQLQERLATVYQPSAWLTRLYVRERGSIQVIPVEQIKAITAADDYACIITEAGRHLIGVRMKDLEARLDPSRFVRIHRSTILHLVALESMTYTGNGRAEVQLMGGETLAVSRTGVAALREAMKG